MTHQNHSLNLVAAVGRVILDEIADNIFTRVEVIPCKTYGVIIVHRIVVIYEFPIRPSAGEYYTAPKVNYLKVIYFWSRINYY